MPSMKIKGMWLLLATKEQLLGILKELSPMERKVFCYHAVGLTGKEIKFGLGGIGTVNVHLARAKTKTDIRHPTEMLFVVHKAGLFEAVMAECLNSES